MNGHSNSGQWLTCHSNEVPGELLCKKMISSHVKKTCYLHTWTVHCCYGYIINRTFPSKKNIKMIGLVFHWCWYTVKHCKATWRSEISLLMLKNTPLVQCAHL